MFGCFYFAVFCYLFGAFLAYKNWMIDWDGYFKMAAIVGGLASVLSILGLVFSPLNDLNSQRLKDLAQKTEEYEIKQQELQEATTQINRLQLKREDLEALVDKASLSLYYKSELKSMYGRLHVLLDNSEDITKLVDEIQIMECDAKKLDCEIEKNEDISEIIAIIQKAKEKTERKLKFTDIILSFMGNQITVRL